jgi:hypothetical protein
MLSDGKEISFSEKIDYFEESFTSETTLPELNSAIIRSFETKNNSVQDLKKYVSSISESRKIGYWNFIPDYTVSDPTYAFPSLENNYSYDWTKIKDFPSYYHSLFQNKMVRNYLFDEGLEFVSYLCAKYPSDFQKRVLIELDNLNNFLISLNNPNIKVDTTNIQDYWKGFIYRRHIYDKISISEMSSLISKAISRIKSIDQLKKDNHMYEFNINNQLVYFISGNNNVLFSKVSQKRIVLPKNVNFWKVKYLMDKTGEYYLFSQGQDEPKFLYNSKLDKIN